MEGLAAEDNSRIIVFIPPASETKWRPVEWPCGPFHEGEPQEVSMGGSLRGRFALLIRVSCLLDPFIGPPLPEPVLGRSALNN